MSEARSRASGVTMRLRMPDEIDAERRRILEDPHAGPPRHRFEAAEVAPAVELERDRESGSRGNSAWSAARRGRARPASPRLRFRNRRRASAAARPAGRRGRHWRLRARRTTARCRASPPRWRARATISTPSRDSAHSARVSRARPGRSDRRSARRSPASRCRASCPTPPSRPAAPSSTATLRPSCAASNATDRPASPAPITHRSTSRSNVSRACGSAAASGAKRSGPLVALVAGRGHDVSLRTGLRAIVTLSCPRLLD